MSILYLKLLEPKHTSVKYVEKSNPKETKVSFKYFGLEFDPGSGRTLAACFKHASRTELSKLAYLT